MLYSLLGLIPTSSYYIGASPAMRTIQASLMHGLGLKKLTLALKECVGAVGGLPEVLYPDQTV